MLAALVAYHNTFSDPFIFDDIQAIVNNPTIRHLGSSWLPPPGVSGVTGRPLINFSLGINYALGGLDVRGYHALNLAIHVLAAWTLFGIVRRTLLEYPTSKSNQLLNAVSNPETTSSKSSFTREATLLALSVALLWAVHPLQTESVTCVVQRTESLMGLFYLLTLYCFIRGAESQRAEGREQKAEARVQIPEKEIQKPSDFCSLPSGCWLLASVGSCLLGMASKEVMVSAPLIVLLYDRTFVAGSFREAWRQRGRWHAGLACTWLLLGFLVARAGGSRGQAAGFGLGVSSWHYALTQCQAILLYLKLSLWPHPLILDYGTHVVSHLAEVLPLALIVVLLVLTTLIGLWQRPVWGFLGAWFFAILAPSSSVVPLVAQTVAEHRMYLPLAAVIVWAVLGLHALLERRSLVIILALALGLGWTTAQRNRDYRSELAIWRDTVAKCPDNERAHNNLGDVLFKEPGGLSEAIIEFKAALRLDPHAAKPHNNLGNALLQLPGRLPDAMAELAAALRLEPNYAEAHNNLGNALLLIPGRLDDAMAEYQTALRLKPDYAEAHYNLGNVYYQSDRFADALGEYEIAIQLNPDYAEAHNNLGNALAELGRLPEAVGQYELALHLNPGYENARKDLEQVRKAMAQARFKSEN
jgi:tetratricopeptide (TPR) repeat protein